MPGFPWEDEGLTELCRAESTAHDTGVTDPSSDGNIRTRQLSSAEVAALGLPLDDSFLMLPEVFDTYFAGVSKTTSRCSGMDQSPPKMSLRQHGEQIHRFRFNDRRVFSDQMPESVKQAVCIIATPGSSDESLLGAASYLLRWFKCENEREPEIGEIVLWWWKAARSQVDIHATWANEMRTVWKTEARTGALDPAKASVNAFFGFLTYYAACVFIETMGIRPNDDVGRDLLRRAGFPGSETQQIDQLKPRDQRTVRHGRAQGTVEKTTLLR